MSGIVAVVGRPNVGKSTFFNRMTESRNAIVDEVSGVTRDRHYGTATWNGREFTIIDTGGYITNSDDVFEEEIRKQVLIAMEEADVIVLLVDVVTGITDMDNEIAALLRKIDKNVVVGVNKVDNNARILEAAEFYSLGLGDYFCISSINGSGTGDILDAIVESLPDEKEEELPDIPKFSIIGRPNVGKSSLLNTLIGEERHIVTPIAGTTRDAIGTRYNKFGYDFFIIDTAGLRKKNKVHDDLEFYSVMRSVRAIESSDVCLMLIDARYGVEAQDMNIYQLVIRNRKGVVICVNKWDLVDKETNTAKEYEKKIKEKLAPFKDVPVIFTSALTKQRIQKILEKAHEVHANRIQKINTAKLNELMLGVIEQNPPPTYKGKFVKIKYVTQLPTHVPSFAFFCNNSKYIKEPYRRFLENRLRSFFNFEGVPIKLYMRDK